MTPIKQLDDLYDRASKHPGWISFLVEASAITPEDVIYLSWRDDCMASMSDSLTLWMGQLERDGGIEMQNADTPQERLAAVIERVKDIEKWVSKMPNEIAEAYREIVRYRTLLLLRAQLALTLEPPATIPEWKLLRARAYRLDDLLRPQLKKKFMICPIHKEKNGSFYVTAYGFCFGCLRSWDSISWLMEFEKMSFPQAVEHLCSLA